MLFVAKEEEMSRDLHEMLKEGLLPKKDDSENSELDPNEEDSETTQLDAKEDSKTSQLHANEDSETSQSDAKEDSKTSQLDANEDSNHWGPNSDLFIGGCHENDVMLDDIIQNNLLWRPLRDSTEVANHTTTTLNKNEVPAKKITFLGVIYSALHWLVSILFCFVGGLISTKISFLAAPGKKLQAECQQVLINSLFCFLALFVILGSRMITLRKMFLTAYAFGALYAVRHISKLASSSSS